jgi:hypothetical protein
VSIRRRVVAYGYRYGEVALPSLPAVKSSAVISKDNQFKTDRLPVAVSLGCHTVGSAHPHPDPRDSDTMRAGVSKRFAVQPPPADSALLRDFKKYVRSWLKKNMRPLAPDADDSFDTWIDNAEYPEWRRAELRDCHARVGSIYERESYFHCKSFMKDETYPEFKHARGINARSDEFKCEVGPMFKLIEKELFKRPEFIKKIPVLDRPKYIMDKLFRVGAKYIATDYTSFESLFTREVMEACEFQLYEHMTQRHNNGQKFMKLIRHVLLGTNVCKYKYFTVRLEATRMSGEMCTSLGNGFSNLMFLYFMCDRLGSKVACCVEGDDCIARIEGTIPTSEDFKQLGLNIKLEVHDDLATASFCGLVFDVDDLLNVTDPRKILNTFGWSTERYVNARDCVRKRLLRAKALSLAHAYPGCPILSALARYALRVTRSHDVRHLVYQWRNSYEREWMMSIMECPPLEVEPPIRTRLLVEKLYGVPVSTQILIEEWLDTLQTLQPLDHPSIIDFMTLV